VAIAYPAKLDAGEGRVRFGVRYDRTRQRRRLRYPNPTVPTKALPASAMLEGSGTLGVSKIAWPVALKGSRKLGSEGLILMTGLWPSKPLIRLKLNVTDPVVVPPPSTSLVKMAPPVYVTLMLSVLPIFELSIPLIVAVVIVPVSSSGGRELGLNPPDWL
jgi:hypothetical protein